MTRPETLWLEPGETMPNSTLPVLIYRGALSLNVDGKALGFDELFRTNGWRGTWRDGVYDYDHFHSNAHEVLGVEDGSAQLQLGGETGQAVDVVAGDVLILPAGTGHRRNSKSESFIVIGGYPPGQERPDICRSRDPEAEMRISKTALPTSDPVLGATGGVLEFWR